MIAPKQEILHPTVYPGTLIGRLEMADFLAFYAKLTPVKAGVKTTREKS